MPRAYLLFHLNLAYSSIPVSARPEVIQRCYRPLLRLAETTGIPVGIELSGWTLRQIHALAPDWVAAFRNLLHAGRCELIGSGGIQLIGPLVPYEVNVWNQKLGLADYEQLLGVRPRIALVNEMAYSSGLVSLYRQAGYAGIVMDRDNVRLALGIEHAGSSDILPTHALGTGGETIPVLWSDSILFQKLQRYAHGDIALAEYLDYFRARSTQGDGPLPVYSNDAEVFDYRPGRFHEEAVLNGEGEWNRLERLLGILARQEGVAWCLPSQVLDEIDGACPRRTALLSSVAQPLPVKKQAKYNISRWAVTGRNDIWLNTLCHRLYRQMKQAGEQNPDVWRELCELWSSDLRTHITHERWEEARSRTRALAERTKTPLQYGTPATDAVDTVSDNIASLGGLPEGIELEQDDDNILLAIRTPLLRLSLNLRRGLTLNSLAFDAHEFVPVIGVLPHGYFSSIELGADFYSGGVVIELPAEHRRLTDLERVAPRLSVFADRLEITAQIALSHGPLVKQIIIDRREACVRLRYRFPGWTRPHGIVRAGLVTLLPEAFSSLLSLECVNGGEGRERFMLDRECDHAQPSSSLVSCTTGLGATTGEILLGDDRRGISLTWDPSRSAVFPMLIHRPAHPHPLTRVLFSLSELDDTSRPEGALSDFELSIRPRPAV